MTSIRIRRFVLPLLCVLAASDAGATALFDVRANQCTWAPMPGLETRDAYFAWVAQEARREVEAKYGSVVAFPEATADALAAFFDQAKAAGKAFPFESPLVGSFPDGTFLRAYGDPSDYFNYFHPVPTTKPETLAMIYGFRAREIDRKLALETAAERNGWRHGERMKYRPIFQRLADAFRDFSPRNGLYFAEKEINGIAELRGVLRATFRNKHPDIVVYIHPEPDRPIRFYLDGIKDDEFSRMLEGAERSDLGERLRARFKIEAPRGIQRVELESTGSIAESLQALDEFAQEFVLQERVQAREID